MQQAETFQPELGPKPNLDRHFFSSVPSWKAFADLEKTVGIPIQAFFVEMLRPHDMGEPLKLKPLAELKGRVVEDISDRDDLGRFFSKDKPPGTRYALIMAREKPHPKENDSDILMVAEPKPGGLVLSAYEWWKQPKYIDIKIKDGLRKKTERTDFLELKWAHEIFNTDQPTDSSKDQARNLIGPITGGTGVKIIGLLPNDSQGALAKVDAVIKPNIILVKDVQGKGTGKVATYYGNQLLESSDMWSILIAARDVGLKGLKNDGLEISKDTEMKLSLFTNAMRFLPNKIMTRIDRWISKWKRNQAERSFSSTPQFSTSAA